jgi:cutinase
MSKRRTSTLLACLLATAGLSLVTGPAAHATAPCDGTYSIAVGGTGSTWNNDGFYNVTQHVGYDARFPTGANARTGVNELNRLVRDQRAACPGQHVKMMGYSLGAAVVHVWVSENWQTFDNVNAILVADPKRQGPPGANGSGEPFGGIIGFPLAGTDRNFGNVPVKTICNWDYICDASADPTQYPKAHMENYPNDWDGDHHNDNANEMWFNGAWYPANW